MNAKSWGLLLLLALLWGSSFFFYKILVAVLPPVTVVLGRVGIAAIAMNLWLLATGRSVPLSHGRWRRFLLLGFLNNVLPFILIAWGETRIESGLASILNATTPIFMVAVAHWGTEDEKLSWAKGASIVLGILGVTVLVGADAFGGGSSIWGELAVVAASCVYGFGGVYSRRSKDLPPLVAATGQVSGGAVILLPLSLLIDQPWRLPMPDADVWAALLAIALVNTALAYFVYYRMLAGAGVTYISLVTFLIPVIALMLGAIFLDERVTVQALAGMAVITLGLAAIDGRLLKPRSNHHLSK
ncbi:MAG TPA: DMT family transporter [Rhizomicrobium sp.]|nr:DMT family transporter [Rhizomicrobium sp.]